MTIPIPKEILNDNYPAEPKTFGERPRKARMDAGLRISELAELVGVTGDTIINWELRGMRPHRREVRVMVKGFFTRYTRQHGIFALPNSVC